MPNDKTFSSSHGGDETQILIHSSVGMSSSGMVVNGTRLDHRSIETLTAVRRHSKQGIENQTHQLPHFWRCRSATASMLMEVVVSVREARRSFFPKRNSLRIEIRGMHLWGI